VIPLGMTDLSCVLQVLGGQWCGVGGGWRRSLVETDETVSR
jgi:hypothetical protein